MKTQQQAQQTGQLNMKKKHHKNIPRKYLLLIIISILALIIATTWILSIIGVVSKIAATIISAIVAVSGAFVPLFQSIHSTSTSHFSQATSPSTLDRLEQLASNIISGNQDTPQLTTIWYVPYRRNSFFTGRKETLDQLHDKLRKTNDLAQLQPQILSGLGGIGKTQIALEYAYSHQQEYNSVLWLRTETPSTLIADIMTIPTLFPSQKAETSEQNERVIISAFREWLAKHEDWLLILDNVDDLQIVHELLPTKGKGHVLLTTRIQAVGNAGNRIEVKKLDQKEGVLFLLRRAKKLALDSSYDQISEKNNEDAQAIVKAVEGLPLALDQAGAYIEETQSSLSEYYKLLETSNEKILLRRGITSTDHPESVASTFSLSFQKVEHDNSSSADLLRFFAFLSPDEIPEELIKEGLYALDSRFQKIAVEPLELSEAITILLKYSLIRRNPDTQTVTIHRLVQVIIKSMMDNSTQRQWAEQTVCAVNQAFPETIATIQDITRRKRLFFQVQACFTLIEQWNMQFSEAASLLYKAAQYLRSQQRYAEAVSISQRVLMIQELLSGSEHLDVVDALNALALGYRGLDKYEQSEAYYLQALSILKKTLGLQDRKTLRSMSNLGFLYYVQENYEKAEQITKEVLVLREQTLGPESLSASTSLNNLALIYAEQGKLEEAEALYNRALAIRIQISGPQSGNVAITLFNIGSLYAKQGKYDQAETFMRRAITIREQRFQEDTISTSEALLGLANLYKTQGKYKKAEPLYERVLSIREKVIGLRPTKMREILEDYADLLKKMKREKEAVVLENRVTAIKDETNPKGTA